LVERNATGWVVVPEGETTPTRCLVPTDPPITLLATPTAALAVGHAGLHLLKRHRVVTAWRETPEALMLVTPSGPVRIGRASLSALMLRTLADGAGAAMLTSAPLAILAAPVFDGLSAACTLAGETGGIVDVHRAPAWSGLALRA
jgi:hypothetical protein